MEILTRDLFLYNPETRKLVNEGVANVNDSIKSTHDLDVLRYELETFVCDGQYEHGLQIILETFMNNIGQAEQPAAWVSGFFGSGKSHLVKMLRALWINTKFPDGATARGCAILPNKIKDLLTELEGEGRRYGGLHAASGTLGAGVHGSVRLSLLQIIFRSVDLPEQYPIAKFVMWMKGQGILDSVREIVEANGCNWETELDSFLLSESIQSALAEIKPSVFSSVDVCAELLAKQYQFVQDVTSEEMLKSIKDALLLDGKFPLTILVLDEVQQYIGEDPIRSLAVQEAIEDCSKRFNGRLMVVGTGQTAITGTSNLKKLEGRFTIRVELSDSDVDEVIRKVILAKKPDKIDVIGAFFQKNLGEISRHLADTKIRHRQSDIADFAKDYPILPVRRRFWEEAFRVLDPTGTSAQLRNQLAMIHTIVRESAKKKLGYMVPADYLYFNNAIKLLSNKMLNRRYYDLTMEWVKGSEDEVLTSRACAIVYLINKIDDRNRELGLKATVDTIADLMLHNLSEGSASLRSKLPNLLNECPLLMKIDDEYRMQTEENTAWNDEFASQKIILESESYRITGDRLERLQKKVDDSFKNIQCVQGNSKVKRNLTVHYGVESPMNSNKQIAIWVRDGWMCPDSSVILEARQAGNSSSVIHVFIPKKNSEELISAILDSKAAKATLERRGRPTTVEGTDAYNAMKTTMDQAETKINNLLEETLSEARVIQSGGNEIGVASFESMIKEAVRMSAERLYNRFEIADNGKWYKVLDRAKKGATDALSLIGYTGDVSDNPVCKEIISFIGSGKKGIVIRNFFQDPPYGWSQDAVDGALLILLASGIIRAKDSTLKVIKANEIERKAIGTISFNVETVVLTTQQKIDLRKLMSMLQIEASQTNLGEFSVKFLDKLEALAESAGGDVPKPEKPNTMFIEELRSQGGNDQLYAIYMQKEVIGKSIQTWQEISSKISKVYPNWELLKRLMHYATPIDYDKVFVGQVEIIEQHRKLLAEPDLIEPLIKGLNQLLRDELNTLHEIWANEWETGESLLLADESWNKLTPEDKYNLRLKHQLLEINKPSFEVDDSTSIIKTLDKISLEFLRDRIAAMSSRYNQILLEAAKMMEPKAQIVDIKKVVLHSVEDIKLWVKESEAILKEALKKGPVVIR
jgi:tetrahydromethanopterin S-methyltransferase subunit G